MYHYCNKILLKSVPKGQREKKKKKKKQNKEKAILPDGMVKPCLFTLFGDRSREIAWSWYT